MKVLFICCLAIVGALGFPQNSLNNEYELSNNIDDNSYEVYKKSEFNSGLNAPFQLYKELMNMKSNDISSMTNLLRVIIKPILSSIEFRVLTDFVAETLRLFKEDPQIKAMVRQGVDSIQGLYEGSNGKLANQLVTWMVSRYSDEETARSISSLMSDMNPSLQSWLVEPVKSYYRSYITPTFASIANAMTSFFGEDLASNEIARSGRWSSIVDMYIERLVDMTSEARDIMLQTAEFLQQQDESY